MVQVITEEVILINHYSFLCRPTSTSLGFTIFGETFVYVTVFVLFLNPAIEVVTFRLRGWCMLGVFLSPAFTRLGHEYQDLSGPCDGMYTSTD